MSERNVKIDVNFSWHLVWIFALLEGITVPLAPLLVDSGPSVKADVTAGAVAPQDTLVRDLLIIGVYGIIIGLFGTLVICLLLNYLVFPKVKLHLDDGVLLRVAHPVITGLWGGLLLATIFWIQHIMGSLLVFPMIVNLLLWGFVSAAGSIVIIGFVYLLTVKRFPYLGIKVVTTERRLLLVQIPIVSFAILVGVYEGLAMPILQIWTSAPHHKVLIALLVGLSGGALCSSIVVALAHLPVIKRHMWLKFSTIA
jgi:hypothetical protein